MTLDQLAAHSGGVDEYLSCYLASAPLETWVITVCIRTNHGAAGQRSTTEPEYHAVDGHVQGLVAHALVVAANGGTQPMISAPMSANALSPVRAMPRPNQ